MQAEVRFHALVNPECAIYKTSPPYTSDNLNTHRPHVCMVLLRLRYHCLYTKLEKCLFEQTQVPFLGYIVTDPPKLQAISNWPQPSDLKATQQFSGFTNFYRQFIHSSMVAPITSLTRKGASARTWPPEAVEAFHKLKTAFLFASILKCPDILQPFFLEVDASSLCLLL
ncbi:uncharacterized protein LOC143925733 [Lithobates pipiens]